MNAAADTKGSRPVGVLSLCDRAAWFRNHSEQQPSPLSIGGTSGSDVKDRRTLPGVMRGFRENSHESPFSQETRGCSPSVNDPALKWSHIRGHSGLERRSLLLIGRNDSESGSSLKILLQNHGALETVVIGSFLHGRAVPFLCRWGGHLLLVHRRRSPRRGGAIGGRDRHRRRTRDG